MSNSDILKNEKASFANVRMPLRSGKGLDTEELPFIVGVIDDFRGNAERALKKRGDLVDRKFDKVSRYTLEDKIKQLEPGLDLMVENTLPGTDEKDLHVELNFTSMKHFGPKYVAEQIPQLKKLLDLSRELRALKSRAGARPETRKELEKLVQDLMEVANRT